MEIQWKKGVVELCLLAIISQKDMYGYEILQKTEETLNLSDGTIYPMLRKLTKEKYLETYKVKSTDGPPRKYYRITAIGIIQLQEIKQSWNGFVGKIGSVIDVGVDSNE